MATKEEMAIADSSWELQWQPMQLSPTKEERWEMARQQRKLKQKQREETVIFEQSLLFCAGLAVIGFALLLIL